MRKGEWKQKQGEEINGEKRFNERVKKKWSKGAYKKEERKGKSRKKLNTYQGERKGTEWQRRVQEGGYTGEQGAGETTLIFMVLCHGNRRQDSRQGIHQATKHSRAARDGNAGLLCRPVWQGKGRLDN